MKNKKYIFFLFFLFATLSKYIFAYSTSKLSVDSTAIKETERVQVEKNHSIWHKINNLAGKIDTSSSLINANRYLKLAEIYFQLRDYNSAEVYATKSLNLSVENESSINVLKVRLFLSKLRLQQKPIQINTSELVKLLKSARNIEDDSCIMIANQVLSSYYFERGTIDSAMLYFFRFQNYFKKSNDIHQKIFLARLYSYQNKPFIAKSLFDDIVAETYVNNDIVLRCNAFLGLANAYMNLEMSDSALSALQLVLNLSVLNKFDYLKLASLHYYAKYYKLNGKFDKSLDYYERYNFLKDSLISAEQELNLQRISEELKLSESRQQTFFLKTKNEQKNIIIILLIIVLVLGVIITAYMVTLVKRNRRLTYELQTNNEELKVNSDLLATKAYEQMRMNKELKAVHLAYKSQIGSKELIDEKLKEKSKSIMESLFYARNIQHALLPPTNIISSSFLDAFVLWKPREVVSGDFYWFKELGDFYYLALGDCTGHGVPGAFMSVLGISYLNEIMSKHGLISTGKVLDILNEKVLTSLNQIGSEKILRDGMDISLIKVNKNTGESQFSGAYNNAYLVKKLEDDEVEVIDLKADRRPIGLYGKYDSSFNEIDFMFSKGIKMYLSSDGYTDQFGGDKQKKFMKKRFRAYLASIYKYPMYYQKIFLNEKIMSWKGDNDQLDDILIIGLEF